MLGTRIRNVLACCLHRCQECLHVGDVRRAVLGMSHARQATHCFSLGVQGDKPISPRETLSVQRDVTHVSCNWHGMLGTASIFRSSTGSTITATQTRDPVDHVSNIILPAPLAIVDDVQTSLLSDHLIQIQNPIGWARQRAHVRCANPGTAGIRLFTQWCRQQSCRWRWRNLHYRFQWHDSWHHRSLRMLCLYGGNSFEAFQVASNGPAGWLIHDPLNGDAARAKLVLQTQTPPNTKWTHILMQTHMRVNMKIGNYNLIVLCSFIYLSIDLCTWEACLQDLFSVMCIKTLAACCFHCDSGSQCPSQSRGLGHLGFSPNMTLSKHLRPVGIFGEGSGGWGLVLQNCC